MLCLRVCQEKGQEDTPFSTSTLGNLYDAREECQIGRLTAFHSVCSAVLWSVRHWKRIERGCWDPKKGGTKTQPKPTRLEASYTGIEMLNAKPNPLYWFLYWLKSPNSFFFFIYEYYIHFWAKLTLGGLMRCFQQRKPMFRERALLGEENATNIIGTQHLSQHHLCHDDDIDHGRRRDITGMISGTKQ